jgi:hypothetical protein
MSNIVELNRDVEQFLIQATVPRSKGKFGEKFGDKYVPLAFAHTSDMHHVPEAWARMVEYVNYYRDYLSFAICTGDYCGLNHKSYTDLYAAASHYERPFYNCVGNHDCCTGEGPWALGPKESTYALLFNHPEHFADVTFMDCPHSMSFYKDFPESNLRFIVLDDYYHIEEARVWLRGLLEEAHERGLHVMTAQHEATNFITKPLDVTFQTLDPYVERAIAHEPARTWFVFDKAGRPLFEDVIVDFINAGGVFVCNIAGHSHVDMFGYTEAGVLNVVVPAGTMWDKNNDHKRVKGTKSQDCFNVVAGDADLGLVKLVRVGANVDHFLRRKTALCYDYINKKVISNL